MENENPAPAEPQVDGAMDTVRAPEPEPTPEPKPEPRSRMDSLQKAFDEVDGKEAKPETKEPKAEGDDRPRNPDGTFAARDPNAAQPAKPEAKAEAKPEDVKPEKAPVSEAPQRFSADAKEAWKDAPESVRGEIQRAITELESGLRQKDEQLTPLKPFMDMAAKHGTTVHDALQNYVNMENALRSDPAKGLQALARNMGLTPEQMAGYLTGQQSDNQKDQQISQLMQEIDGLKEQINGFSQTFEQSQQDMYEKEFKAFQDDGHPRFEELRPVMAQLMNGGMAADMAEAYEMAERLNPAPQPAAPPPPPPPQTRQPQSVIGAPNAGSNPGNRQPSKTRTEALGRAFNAVGL